MGNRAQRRAIARLSKARKNNQSFAEAIGAKKMVEAEVRRQVHDENVKLEAEIMTQRFLWEAVIALNIAFGFGQERARKFLEALDTVLHDVEQDAIAVDKQYAFEKVRQRAAQITGKELRYVHEAEMLAAKKENEAQGIFFPPDEDL